jgi:hypothetical protein
MKLLKHLAEKHVVRIWNKTLASKDEIDQTREDFLTGAKAVLDILRSKEAHDLDKDAFIHPKGWAKIINAMKAEE